MQRWKVLLKVKRKKEVSQNRETSSALIWSWWAELFPAELGVGTAGHWVWVLPQNFLFFSCRGWRFHIKSIRLNILHLQIYFSAASWRNLRSYLHTRNMTQRLVKAFIRLWFHNNTTLLQFSWWIHWFFLLHQDLSFYFIQTLFFFSKRENAVFLWFSFWSCCELMWSSCWRNVWLRWKDELVVVLLEQQLGLWSLQLGGVCTSVCGSVSHDFRPPPSTCAPSLMQADVTYI